MIAPDSLDRVLADADALSAQPLWTVMESMVPPHPMPRAVPHLWRYAAFRPILERAAALVGTAEAERRVLMLVNPALRAPYTTDTLYAGLQIIRPGEVARAHRHRAFALRFIIEGDGAYTAVGGEKVTMERGDVILTPSWQWHDHGHEGDRAMVWLDGLDLPFFQAIPVNFAEPYSEERYPSIPAGDATPLKFGWATMRGTLDDARGDHALVRYEAKDGSGPISRIIGAAAERIGAGHTSAVERSTASAVVHVVEGRGRTRVGDVDLAWEQGDTFCVPAWAPFAHTAETASYLFRFDDRPLLEALGLFVTEA